MARFNQLTLIGNLGADPESKTIGTGDKLCEFRIPMAWREKGENKTEWVRVTVWGKMAEWAAELRKGDACCVSGELSVRHFEHEGKARFQLELQRVDRFSNLTPKAKEVSDLPF